MQRDSSSPQLAAPDSPPPRTNALMVRTSSFARSQPPQPSSSSQVVAAPNTASIPPPGPTLEDVRNQASTLANNEVLDKTSALSVMHLFHAMETLLRYECTRRDRKIDELEACLGRATLQLDIVRAQEEEASTQALAPTPLPVPSSITSSASKKRSRW